MINHQMKPYELYINNPTTGNFNEVIDNWEFVGEVMAAVNFVSMTRITDDIRYKDCQYTGITRHKGLNLSKEYKLVPKGQTKPEYFIRSINELSRLTQYLMQAVF